MDPILFAAIGWLVGWWLWGRPVDLADDPALVPGEGPSPRPCLLLVEDDWTSHDALRKLFRRKGWEVLSAMTVAGGLALLEARPDCVILDLMLPDGDGAAILRKVRSDHLPIRVVVTTGLSDPTRLRAVADLKPDAVLQKPIDLAAEYRISSFSFLVQGGDNFHEFANGTDTVDTGLIDRDAWFAYIEDESPLSPIYAKSGIDVVGLPTDATLRGMMDRWATEYGGKLDWQYPTDLTLVSALTEVKDNNLQAALNVVRKAYGDQRLRVQVLTNKTILVRRMP